MKIGNLDTAERVLLVAEIGNNHEGDPGVARELVRCAADAGADAVKFQTFDTDHYVSRAETARHARLKSFELPRPVVAELAALARSLGLLFVSTPFDLGSAEFLEPLVDAFKIASGDNTFYPLIGRVAQTGKPLIISTGLSDVADIQRALSAVHRRWPSAPPPPPARERIAILHCVSAYPTPPEQANVRAVRALAQRFDCTIGYSDHTVGTEAAVLAVALGARIVEKHFTLDKHYSEFRDHQLSADPPELAELARRIRLATTLLGTGVKTPQPCEAAGREALRRSIVAGTHLPRGHRISLADLTWIRPGGGLPPGEEHQLVGRVLTRNVAFGEPLRASDVADVPIPARARRDPTLTHPSV
jgi:sialic acid synthase SpsE